MKNLLIVITSILIGVNCFSQNNMSRGDSLREKGKLKDAIKQYKIDYKNNAENWRNTYNLACAYSLTFQKDSAFHYLNIALKNDFSLWALADSDLYALIDDPRWLDIEKQQLKRYQQNNKKLKKPEYTLKLLNIILKDQALDYYVDQAKAYFVANGNPPQWYYPLGAYKQSINKNGYENMLQLIETSGWPKYSEVGKLAADAPLLIINHHESDSIRKRHLQQIKKSCIENEGSCMEYAKIQDRILVNEGSPQIYGMQFRYNAKRNLEPFPIENPEYVDIRRKEIGLEPLKDYLKRKINYDFKVIQKTQ